MEAEKQRCAGCGKETQRWSDVEIAPGVTVRVCRAAQRYGDAKKSCLDKAVAKAEVCPGCGKEHFRGYGVCRDCAAAIVRGTSATTPVEPVTIVHDDLFHWLDSSFEDRHELQGRLREALVAVLLGPGCRRGGTGRSRLIPENPRRHVSCGRVNSSHATVEIAKTQADGLEELMAILAEVYDKQRLSGRAEGKALLVQLAEGKVSVADFEDRERKLSKL
jgi:hypothetical protein